MPTLDSLLDRTWNCVSWCKGRTDPHLVSEATAAGLIVREIDAAAISDREDLFRMLSASFSFPDYFGMNWDALDECLADLEWLGPFRGIVLIVHSSHFLWGRAPLLAGGLVESWTFAAESHAPEGRPMKLIFDDLT